MRNRLFVTVLVFLAFAGRFTYGYDRASNRLYRENTSTSGHDDYYTSATAWRDA